MTNEGLQTLSQLLIAIGILMTALGGYGSYYFQKKIDLEKTKSEKPIIDICHRGISVKKVDPHKVFFDIPYCAGKNANAHNVKLEVAIIIREDDKLILLSPFSHQFPDNITLTYETGKAIYFSLSPFDYEQIVNTYICVSGSYTNEDLSSKFTVNDIFKFNSLANNWVRTLGNEDQEIRDYIEKHNHN